MSQEKKIACQDFGEGDTPEKEAYTEKIELYALVCTLTDSQKAEIISLMQALLRDP